MKQLVVTAGQPFTDIDALGAAIAYAELLSLEGKRAQAVLPGPINVSITPMIKSWGLIYTANPTSAALPCVVVDVSDPDQIAEFARERIIEIYDHHVGFEKYWRDRIGEAAHIEFLGAACTLIWEQFVKRGYAGAISSTSTNLLLTGIMSNTLNFKANLTQDRDRQAYDELWALTTLPTDWPQQYYAELESETWANLKQAIVDDTKIQKIPNLKRTITIGQLELWEAEKILQHKLLVEEVLTGFGETEWIMTCPSISEGVNYMFTRVPVVQALLSQILGVSWRDNVAVTDRLWMRKEILKELYAL